MKTILKIFILSLAIFTQTIAQQPFTLDKNIKPIELKWVDYKDTKNPNLSGKVCFTKVTQNRDTAYYFVRGCSMYQPVFFAVSALNKNQKLKISLAKDNWKQPQKKGVTDTKGEWSSMFKTEGGFGIMVVKQNPSVKYNIRVWLGKEFEDLGMPNPFQKK